MPRIKDLFLSINNKKQIPTFERKWQTKILRNYGTFATEQYNDTGRFFTVPVLDSIQYLLQYSASKDQISSSISEIRSSSFLPSLAMIRPPEALGHECNFPYSVASTDGARVASTSHRHIFKRCTCCSLSHTLRLLLRT